MVKHGIAVSCAACLALVLIACRSSNAPNPASDEGEDLQSVQQATDAYLAFERGECEAVEILTRPASLDSYGTTEVLYSMLLLRGFCLEIDEDLEGARAVYRDVIAQGPQSFGAADALERLRILQRIEDDADYASWVDGARDRANLDHSDRTPLERGPVQYPPVPKAAGIEGYAVVEFGITRTGETDDPIVVDARPRFVFDGASLRAVRQWVFESDPDADPNHRQIIRLVFRPALIAEPEVPPASP